MHRITLLRRATDAIAESQGVFEGIKVVRGRVITMGACRWNLSLLGEPGPLLVSPHPHWSWRCAQLILERAVNPGYTELDPWSVMSHMLVRLE